MARSSFNDAMVAPGQIWSTDAPNVLLPPTSDLDLVRPTWTYCGEKLRHRHGNVQFCEEARQDSDDLSTWFITLGSRSLHRTRDYNFTLPDEVKWRINKDEL